MANLCKHRMKNASASNYHIFLNSVEGITKIINNAGLKPDDVRVICSNSEESSRKNQSKLTRDFSISNTSEPVKPINFYTSTCFEGQDIYDEDGRTFIVSEAYKRHTMVDISTSFIQICGRIRNSKYKNEVVHFYATSHYKDCPTFEEFENLIEEKIKEAEEFAKDINNMSAKSRKKLMTSLLFNEPYITIKDDSIIVDRNMANFEIVNYKIVHGTYRTQINMLSALHEKGFNVKDNTAYIMDDSIDVTIKRKISFKDMFDEYCRLKKAEQMYSFGKNFQIEDIENRNPLIKDAYEILGADEVIRMKYHQSNIKRRLIAKEDRKIAYKIVQMIETTIPYYECQPLKQIKMILQDIYDELGLTKRAKSTDLEE